MIFALFSKSARLALVSGLVFAQAGCASHAITAADPLGTGIAGQYYQQKQVSVFGDQGVNSQGTTAVAKQCAKGMSEVRMQRDLGQSLVTLLTLGVVTPSTIRYKCTVDGAPDPN